MIVKFFKLILIFILVSCVQSHKLQDKLKIGLLDFSVNKSNLTLQIESGKTPEFGSLWTGFNKINIRTNQNSLIADVNVELSTSLNYDGGFELLGDTLILYAKCLDSKLNNEKVHSTLTYKISSNGLKYKEIEFKELK